VIGYGPLRSKKVQISPENTPYFISLLSKIYSDPEGSIVRELTSNGFDAHIKGNVVGEPVIIRHYIDEVDQSYIEFVDSGCGISPQAMDDIYMSLGESDKRQSDDYLGAFGLGSKTPFSYTPWFYLITKVDGVEYTYLLSESVEGSNYDLLNTRVLEADEQNGTTVRVPIKKSDIQLFSSKINHQLKYFTDVYVVGFPGVVNEYSIKKFNTFQIREDLFVASPYVKLHVTLGKVTYPINWSVIDEPEITVNAALTFDIGELDVVFSREELKYTEKTKRALKEKLTAFKEEFSGFFRKAQLEETNLRKVINRQFLYKDDLITLNITDTPTTFSLSQLPFLKKEDLYWNINNRLYISNLKLYNRLLKGFECILRKSAISTAGLTKTNAHKYFHQFSSSYGLKKNPLIGDEVAAKVCLIKPGERLKLNERAYLNDNRFSAVIAFNKHTCVREIVKLLLNNKDLNKGELNYVRNLYKEVEGIVERDILKSNNIFFLDELNIDKNYGKSAKKVDLKTLEDVLIYGNDSSSTLHRMLVKRDKIDAFFQFFNYIFYTCDRNRKEDLNLISKTLRRFKADSINYSRVFVFYCSKKYKNCFEGKDRFFCIDDVESTKKDPSLKLFYDAVRETKSLGIVENRIEELPYLSSFVDRFSRYRVERILGEVTSPIVKEFLTKLLRLWIQDEKGYSERKSGLIYNQNHSYVYQILTGEELKEGDQFSKKHQAILKAAEKRNEFLKHFYLEVAGLNTGSFMEEIYCIELEKKKQLLDTYKF